MKERNLSKETWDYLFDAWYDTKKEKPRRNVIIEEMGRIEDAYHRFRAHGYDEATARKCALRTLSHSITY